MGTVVASYRSVLAAPAKTKNFKSRKINQKACETARHCDGRHPFFAGIALSGRSKKESAREVACIFGFALCSEAMLLLERLVFWEGRTLLARGKLRRLCGASPRLRWEKSEKTCRRALPLAKKNSPALGRLAAGAPTRISNPLTAIIGLL